MRLEIRRVAVAAAVVGGLAAALPASALRAPQEPEQVATESAPASAPRLEIDGLIEFEGGLLRRGQRPRGTGQLVIEDDWIRWTNTNRKKRSTSFQTAVVREATLECARRAGSNVCLGLVLQTVTGLRLNLRDTNWEAGESARIHEVFEFLKAHYPRILYGERTVKTIQ